MQATQGAFAMTKRILIVDDSATVRQQVRAALEQVGFIVIEAVDGQDAVQKMSGDFNGIVCDVNMPRMNGVEFVEVVKKQPEHASLPILMLTTEGSPELIRRAKAAGAKGWIVKPFKPDQLVAAMQKLTG
jgi:two-component system chemotaxis response regulator CheY